MARFRFSAKTHTGEIKAGVVSAVDQQAAITLLQQRGLIVTSVNPEDAARHSGMYGRVTAKDLVVFTRQFSIMLSAGVTVTQALRVLVEQTANAKFQEVIRDILTEVESGSRLSDALAKFPKPFSRFYISMIRSGEASGRLDEIMNQLADQIEKDYNLLSSVRSALVYPGFILGMLLIIGLYLIGSVVPQLGTVYDEFGAKLPLMTRVIVAFGNFLNSYWWLFILLVGIAAYALYMYIKSDEGRHAWDAYKLKLPIVGELTKKIASTRFSRNLSTLISGDIPIVDALYIVAEIAGNREFEDGVKKAAEDVRNGVPLSEALAHNGGDNIPPITTRMIAVGEETGKLDTVLKKIAEFYTAEIDRTIATMSALIEPVTIVLLGLGVAVLIASVLLPIYNLVNVI